MVRGVSDQRMPEGVEACDLGKRCVVSEASLDDQGGEPLSRPLSCITHLRFEGREQATNAGCLRALQIAKEAKLDQLWVNRDNPGCARLDALGYVLASFRLRRDVQAMDSVGSDPVLCRVDLAQFVDSRASVQSQQGEPVPFGLIGIGSEALHFLPKEEPLKLLGPECALLVFALSLPDVS